MRCALLVALLALPATADERAVFYGIWGTSEQCARVPLKPDGTVLATPFEITHRWLSQGQTWCRLDWFPIERREHALFTGAQAQCGEDSIRDYILGMELSGGTLSLRWDVFTMNGPLVRCAGS